MADILRTDMNLSLVDAQRFAQEENACTRGKAPMMLVVYPRNRYIDADIGCTTHIVAVECEHVLRKLQTIVQQIFVAKSPAALASAPPTTVSGASATAADGAAEPSAEPPHQHQHDHDHGDLQASSVMGGRSVAREGKKRLKRNLEVLLLKSRPNL
eukprot:6213093-Pleurochrysis_carterae.AAC.2